MEIKAELIKPYTERQRLDFITNQNYINGYLINETDTSLQALGYTEEELELQEKERISNLKCTKRVFVLMLEKMGLDYFEQILPLIEGNRQAKLEWELCVELERANPLLDILAKELGVTSQQLDKLFQYANGEDVELEVING
jgi:hypothetical protein